MCKLFRYSPLAALKHLNVTYCLIGGLAVNAYVDPVVSLDVDIVVDEAVLDDLCAKVAGVFSLRKSPYRINLDSDQSDLRIQIQRDARYQKFLNSTEERTVLGYPLRVASIENVLRGKLWAWEDSKRRASKRQKDLADIFRLAEEYPALMELLPETIKNLFEK